MKTIASALFLLCILCYVHAEDDIHEETKTEKSIIKMEETTVQNDGQEAENKVLDSGKHDKKKIKIRGPSKKMASKLLPLLMIPLIIQSQLIPMMLLKLKFWAIKALMIGKLALLLIGFNIIRNAYIGADSMEEQYEKDSYLAHSHYGYDGSPEYGSWVNKRRMFDVDPYRGHL